MTTPASISPPKPAASLKGPGAHRNSCRRTLPILTPLSTAGFPSNNASGNTCLSTTAICIRQLMPCSSNNRHLSGKDYTMHFLILAHLGDETALRVSTALKARHGAGQVKLVSSEEL